MLAHSLPLREDHQDYSDAQRDYPLRADSPQQFVTLTRPQQLLLAGYLEPYDEIPNVDDVDLGILKSARCALVDGRTFGALIDWRNDLIDLLRDTHAIGAGLR